MVKNGRYIPYIEKTGPAVAKQQVFENARGEFTMCLDSHVLLYPESVHKLCQYFDANRSTQDLFHGVLTYDDLDHMSSCSTHMKPIWRGEMFGIWSKSKHGVDMDRPPFEIPMHGMGLFACRTSEWLGFNKFWKGFGAEEGYIHMKYRNAGHKVFCLPFLRWWHRFNRIGAVPYVLTMEDKVRNYFHGWIELGENTDSIIEHFKKWQQPQHWQRILAQVRLEIANDRPSTTRRGPTRGKVRE
jgi:glycosyltransferase involved in cell wall biosynthesis